MRLNSDIIEEMEKLKYFLLLRLTSKITEPASDSEAQKHTREPTNYLRYLYKSSSFPENTKFPTNRKYHLLRK